MIRSAHETGNELQKVEFQPPAAPPPPPPNKPTGLAATMTPEALLAAFRRRWLVAILAGTVVGAIGAAAAYMTIPAPFNAFSELRISSVDNRIIFKTAEQRAGFNTYKQTQMKLITSPFVLNKALSEKEVASYSLIAEKPHPVDWLEDNIQVGSPGTEFIRISMTGENPAELAGLVNAVTNSFLEEIVEGEHKSRRERLRQLEKIHRDLDEQLRVKRQSLSKLSESLNVGNMEQADGQAEFLRDLHLQMRQELAQVRMELMRADIQLAARQQTTPDAESIDIPEAVLESYILSEPEYQAARQRVDQLDALVANYKDRLQPGVPLLLEAQKELAAARTRLTDLQDQLKPKVVRQLKTEINSQFAASEGELERQIQLLKAEKEQLEDELSGVKNQEAKTGTISFELDAVTKQIAEKESLASTISGEIERLKIELDTPVDIQMSREAAVPYKRDTSKRVKMAGMAGLAGFGLIAFGIVWLESNTRRLASVPELHAHTPMRILGSVPILPHSARKHHRSSKPNKHRMWHSALAEAIDATRAQVLRDSKLEGLHSFLVVSAMGGEGKTSLSCHLATSLARSGRRVLLVDFDIRRPSIHRLFDLPLGPGICDVMMGEASLSEVYQPAPQPGLTILPAGKATPAAFEKLSSGECRELVDELRREFDLIVIDSSPVLPVSDALILSEYVDAVIFAIRRDVSRVGRVAAAYERLTMLGAPVIGAVAIGLDTVNSSYRYPYHYGYYGYPRNN